MKSNEYQMSSDDLLKAISFDANFEKAYQNHVYSYYLIKNYDKAFEYISVMRTKGFGIDPKFLQTLQKESGRNF